MDEGKVVQHTQKHDVRDIEPLVAHCNSPKRGSSRSPLLYAVCVTIVISDNQARHCYGPFSCSLAYSALSVQTLGRSAANQP